MTEKEKPLDVPEELRTAVAISNFGELIKGTLDKPYNWGRRNSIWPMMFGLACCGIEMISTAASRYDFSRFGMEVMRPSPRQSDLMLVSGTVTKKMLPQIIRLYNQMPEPKYVVAMGACASGGGPFKEGYNVVAGIDKYLPVDVYISGCPPTPQALLNGLIKLQELIDGQTINKVRWYGDDPVEAIPVPVLGPDIMTPKDFKVIKKESKAKGNND